MWHSKAVVLCATLASLAAASGAGIAQAANACADADTNLAMKDCLGKAYLKADKELNVVWKQVLQSVGDADYLTPEQRGAWKKELREAQRAWVQFKEHDCNGAVGYEWWGGSGASGAISSCLLSKTEARTKDLKQRYLDR
jgi:uncharacterized protein YecT (DUF1311 family)